MAYFSFEANSTNILTLWNVIYSFHIWNTTMFKLKMSYMSYVAIEILRCIVFSLCFVQLACTVYVRILCKNVVLRNGNLASLRIEYDFVITIRSACNRYLVQIQRIQHHISFFQLDFYIDMSYGVANYYDLLTTTITSSFFRLLNIASSSNM